MSNSPSIAPSGPSLVPSGQSVSPASVLLGTATLLIIFVWFFWAFIERQFRFAIEQQADWGHTLVIPFIAGWFVWLNRGRILAEPLRPATSGLVIVVLGVAWYSIAALGPAWMRHHNLMGFGVAAVIFGLVLTFCGWRSMRYLWFPIAYLVIFGQTISDRFLEIITFKLQFVATVGSEYGLAIIGYDVSREGHTLKIHEMDRIVPVNVAEACSGMRMLVAFFALGVAMSYRGLDRWWQRVLLVVMAVPTAIFVNVLRVMTLGILSTLDSGFAAGEFHTMVGMLWLLPAFFIYLGVMWILRNLVVGADKNDVVSSDEPLSMRFGPGVRRVFIGGVLVLVVGGMGFSLLANALNVHLSKSPVPLRSSLSLLPSALGPWQVRKESTLDAAMIEELGTSLTISRFYQRGDDGPVLNFHTAYYTDTIDAIPHVPDRCIQASGLVGRTPEPENIAWPLAIEGVSVDQDARLDDQDWPIVAVDQIGGGQLEVHLPLGEPVIRTIEFYDPNQSRGRVHAGYFFIANGRMMPTPAGVKLTAFMGADKHAYYCKIQAIMVGNDDFGREQYLENVGEFLSLALPYMMRSLPDWAEVQDGTYPLTEQ